MRNTIQALKGRCLMDKENKKIIMYDIGTTSSRKIQVKKLLEDTLELKIKIAEVDSEKELKKLEKYRLELQTIENAASLIRLIQADDRLRQNIIKIAIGLLSAVIGYMARGWLQ
jgi:hypothetical protein